MPRKFSISFVYEEQLHSAMVTVCGVDDNKTLLVHVADEALEDLLPGGKLMLDADLNLKNDEPKRRIDPDLISAIINAVQEHEKKSVFK